MIDPLVLDDLVQLSVVDADLAAIEVIDQPRHAGMVVGLRAALLYLEHNGLIEVVERSKWPEWCESPPISSSQENPNGN